jgi:ComF family protein
MAGAVYGPVSWRMRPAAPPREAPLQAALRRLVGLKRLTHRWLDHLAPRACAVCSAALAPGALVGVCMGCLTDLPGAARLRCPRCALPESALACSCTQALWPIDRTVTVADYAPPLDHLIIALKFGRQLPLAQPLGELIGLAWAGHTDPLTLDVLVPVPLGPKRLAARGFNQALEMARALSRSQGGRWPVLPHGLVRVRDTDEQSALDRSQRQGNLQHAFAVRGRLDGCRVGLVDDVMTSGTTAIQAALALRQAGARQVSVLVAARTV